MNIVAAAKVDPNWAEVGMMCGWRSQGVECLVEGVQDADRGMKQKPIRVNRG